MKKIILLSILLFVQIICAQFGPRIFLPNTTEEIAHNGAGNFVLLEGNIVTIRDSLFNITSVDTMDTSYFYPHFYGNPNSNEFYFVEAQVTPYEHIITLYLSYYDGNNWEFNMPIPIVPATDFDETSAGYSFFDVKLHVDVYSNLLIFTDVQLLNRFGSWVSNVILMNVFSPDSGIFITDYLHDSTLTTWTDHPYTNHISDYDGHPVMLVTASYYANRVEFDSLYNPTYSFIFDIIEDEDTVAVGYLTEILLWNEDTFYIGEIVGIYNVTDSGIVCYTPERYTTSSISKSILYIDPDSSTISLVWGWNDKIHRAQFDGTSWVNRDSFYFGEGIGLLKPWEGPIYRDSEGREWIRYNCRNYYGDGYRKLISPFCAYIEEIMENPIVTQPQQLSITSYPNPFNSSITVETSEAGRFFVYNIHGSLVAELNTEPSNNARWSPNANTESGVYLIKAITTDGEESTRLVSYIK